MDYELHRLALSGFQARKNFPDFGDPGRMPCLRKDYIDNPTKLPDGSMLTKEEEDDFIKKKFNGCERVSEE